MAFEKWEPQPEFERFPASATIVQSRLIRLPSPVASMLRLRGRSSANLYYDKKRKLKRAELLFPFTEYLRTDNLALRPTKAEQELRTGDKGIAPFHWEIEFPEVFARENGGFDAIVGNPPFMGGTAISANLGMIYFRHIKMRFRITVRTGTAV